MVKPNKHTENNKVLIVEETSVKSTRETNIKIAGQRSRVSGAKTFIDIHTENCVLLDSVQEFRSLQKRKTLGAVPRKHAFRKILLQVETLNFWCN